MEIENSFVVDAPIDLAWTTLTDIPFIAPCMPGATLTGGDGDTHEGQVKIKVGPVTATYKGSATFIEKDDAAYKAVIDGRGRDARGAGNANALITAQMHAEGADRTRVDIITDLKVTGKVAQFGRGVMQDISEKLLGQFADCLAAKMAELPAAGETASESAAEASTGAASSSTSASSASDPGPAADDNVIDVLDVAGDAAWKPLVPVAAAVAALLGILRLLRNRSRS